MSLEPQQGPRRVGQLIDVGRDWNKAILKVLAAGWLLARKSPDVRPTVDEVTLTEHLRDGMRNALLGLGVDLRAGMTILPGTESRFGTRPRPAGLTDIPVFLTDVRQAYDEHDPHAIIECKRVAEIETDLCRLYVKQGIVDRFQSGKYASHHTTGFMAGYLIAGTVNGAFDKINGYLAQSERLATCTILDEPWTRSSSHPRQHGLAPIELHHAMLNVAEEVSDDED